MQFCTWKYGNLKVRKQRNMKSNVQLAHIITVSQIKLLFCPLKLQIANNDERQDLRSAN